MYQSPRGTQDILPDDAAIWRYVEGRAAAQARRFGYGEIRTPTFEEAGLFLRGVGAGTDIVDKEIYRFEDKGGTDLALRPEGTASVMRAYLEHGLASRPQPLKLYSFLTVFRYDRPQAGRYREFRQFDVEAIGEADPLADAEVIAILWRFLGDLGLRGLTVQLNSIGDAVCRPAYIRALVGYYEPRRDQVCGDCRRRLETNPLRLLDCKNPQCQPIFDGAPRSMDWLCDACERHFTALRGHLDTMELPYVLTPRLVRGLDYYTRTVFEVVPPSVGAQSTIGGGGRYDGLAEEIGGKPTPGVGFAAGLDRIILNLKEQGLAPPPIDVPDVFVAPLGDEAKRCAVALADRLRQADLAVVVGMGDRSARARMRQADGSGARWTVILGEDELRDRVATVKDMHRKERDQERVPFAELSRRLVGLPADNGSIIGPTASVGTSP